MTTSTPFVTDAQAQGLACILCGIDFTDPRAPASVPITLPVSGRQVFVCTPACPTSSRRREDHRMG